MPACNAGENGNLCRAAKRAEYQMALKQGQINQAAFNKMMANTRKNRKNRKNTRRNRKTNRRN